MLMAAQIPDSQALIDQSHQDDGDSPCIAFMPYEDSIESVRVYYRGYGVDSLRRTATMAHLTYKEVAKLATAMGLVPFFEARPVPVAA